MRMLCLGLLALVIPSVAAGKTTSYRPLGSWADPAEVAQARWGADIQAKVDRAAAVKLTDRPRPAGLRPKSVELLEDGLLRKHGRLLGGDAGKARSLLLRDVQRGRTPQLRGYMAEALFLDRNKDWGYVGKPNATQHDVYRWVAGRRTPFNGQIKYHDSGRPSLYARDMIGDYRAARFFIPDDHVGPTKDYLQAQARRLEAVGNKVGAQQRWRDYGRVRPMGSTSTEVRAGVTEAARSIATEKYATYTSLGASLALGLGPTVHDWATGDLSANIAAYRTVRSLSLLGAGVGTQWALQQAGRGALQGTVRGNAIVGTAIAITQTAFLLHEHGWGRAFYQPDFYEELGGGVGSLGLGLAVGTYSTILAAETGPVVAPLIGFGAGTVAGTVGYFGGRAAARAIIELVSPEMLRQEERQRIAAVKASVDRRLAALLQCP